MAHFQFIWKGLLQISLKTADNTVEYATLQGLMMKSCAAMKSEYKGISKNHSI